MPGQAAAQLLKVGVAPADVDGAHPPPIAIDLVVNHLDRLTGHQLDQRLARPVTIGLAALRCINAGQPDLVGLLAAIPEGHRVTVGDGNHHAQQRLGAHRGGNKQRQQQARCGERAQHLPGLGCVRAERRSKDQS
jgi:hypothetical protein